MTSARYRSARGITLLEMLVTLGIYTLILGAVSALFITLLKDPSQRLAALTSIDQARSVGAKFVNEIRNARSGNDGSYAVAVASTTQVTFYSSYGGTSSTTVKRIRYFISNGVLYKGVVTPTGSPLSYNGVTEIVSPVLSNILNGTTSVFTYYDGTYAGTSSPMTQPVNVTRVNYVQMNVTVKKQDTKNSSSTYTYTAGASVRSLKTNLGN